MQVAATRGRQLQQLVGRRSLQMARRICLRALCLLVPAPESGKFRARDSYWIWLVLVRPAGALLREHSFLESACPGIDDATVAVEVECDELAVDQFHFDELAV